MTPHEAIEQTYNFSQMVLQSYLSDLSDEDLLQRPGEGCNHIAWQLGHLIGSECNLLDMVVPGHSIELPDGFVDKHGKENTASNEAADFHSKAEYLELFEKVKAATLAALATQSAEDLDKPGPDAFKDMCPTVGSMFTLIATHVMMHVGQFVPVRRNLGKPVVI